MTKYVLGALMFVLVGGGCLKVTQVPPPAPRLEDLAFPSGSWQFANTDEYALPVDYSFTLEQNGEDVRIQNFVGSDDPMHEYADDAFFIEIRSTTDTRDEFAAIHESVQRVPLSEEFVVLGNDRMIGGDSWPGHSYLHDDRDVVIYMYYRQPEGGEIADAIVQQIRWQTEE